ncbi:MAG TPA: DUF523 domain-containing protein [Candidatus Enteromonas pullicola]|uniref:DUF523 domain-containing protein n=1 Tax=Candidatus Alloenteromonas pullicola TaxID=2840784 RepID=A0A9D1LP17_9FIRM|nr:DUF523 domain-containing protein [Candidatus Enteromonas pullicola]
MEKVLVSACLLGENCRYDGGNCHVEGLDGLTEFFEVVPFCPEVEGGLPIPRFPAELRRGYAKLHSGEDVTRAYDLGASKALNICSYLGIKLAIMKQNSPACGSKKIHNGLFDGKLVEGEGIACARLRKAGIRVIDEEEAVQMLHKLRENKLQRETAKLEPKEEKKIEPGDKKEAKAEAKPKRGFRAKGDFKGFPKKGFGAKRATFDKKGRFGKKESFDRKGGRGGKPFGHGNRKAGRFEKKEGPKE